MFWQKDLIFNNVEISEQYSDDINRSMMNTMIAFGYAQRKILYKSEMVVSRRLILLGSMNE